MFLSKVNDLDELAPKDQPEVTYEKLLNTFKN